MSHAIGLRTCAPLLFVAFVSGCAGGNSALTPNQMSPNQSPPLNRTSAAVARYHVVALSGLGGFLVTGISDDNVGLISGYSVLADNATVHATLWNPSSTNAKDLSTLGGTNSAVEWPNHAIGKVVGISQIAQPDPLGEQWSCSYPAGAGFLPYTGQECRGFVWANGQMHDLGTLGGNNSFATGSNALGQIAGWAETTAHDPTCVSPQVLGFEAVKWDASGTPHALPPLSGDSTSAATAIDSRGDVAGISGICEHAVGARSAAHMVLWKNGVPQQLPNLGGAAWNTPMMLNDEDAVVGFSDFSGDEPGDVFNGHAFLWTAGSGTTDLGTLSGDAVSFAYSINNRGQIVGQSCTPGCAGSRAFLYQNGTMYDLNALLDSSSNAYALIFANDINDAAEITGLALDQNTGSLVGFRLEPSGTISSASVRSASVRRAVVPMFRVRVGPFGRVVPASHG